MTRTEIPRIGRQGIILYVVVMVFLCLSILALHFLRVSREARHVAFRFEKGEVVRQLAQAGMEEAFGRFFRETADPGSKAGVWLLQRSPGSFTVDIPRTEELAGSSVFGSFRAKVRAETRLVDFRKTDGKGRPYYGLEGVGTLEFAVTSSIEIESRPFVSTRLTRHHEYKVVSIVSHRDNSSQRQSYAQNFILDYLLFTRKGLEEFEGTDGKSVNTDRIRVRAVQESLPPERRGKIFFGGTADPSTGKKVFLNVSETLRTIMPPFPAQEIKRITLPDCLKLFPKLQEIENAKPGCLNGLEGVFTATHEPIAKSADSVGNLSSLEKTTRNILQTLATGPEANLDPGLELLTPDPALAGDGSFADSIFEGTLRQRFLYLVWFSLDLSRLSLSPTEAEQLNQIETRIPCAPPYDGVPVGTPQRTFVEELSKLAAQQPAAAPPILSRFDSDFLMKGGLTTGQRLNPDSFAGPAFFNKAGSVIRESDGGSEGFGPFAHVNLWGTRMESEKDLERIGVLDRENQVIKLRGIEWVDGIVTLGGSSKPMQISGKGIIIAKGFRILGSLKKASSQDICVLFASGGNIEIETDQPIEAGLIALAKGGEGGLVRPRRTLDLLGCLAMEKFDSGSWSSAGIHVLRYDTLFKRPDDLYQIKISPAINFQRFSESDS